MPKVSIIVPCYNQAQYLDEALQSVYDQTYQNWECIIVNDGSPDNTEAIAQKWLEKDSRFQYVYKENGGLSSARNVGIKIAQGNFIQLLDCDDLIEDNKLSHHLQFLKEHIDIDITISGYRYFKESKDDLLIMGNNNLIPEIFFTIGDKDVLKVLNIKNPFVISAPLYKKDVFTKVGFFDEDLKALEDWDFHLRCALFELTFAHIGYGKLDKTLIRLHNESMMKNNQLMLQNERLFYEKRNNNPLYLKYFKAEGKTVLSSRKHIKYFIKVLIPPLFVILYKKIFCKK